MSEIDSKLRYKIIEDDFNLDNKCSFAFYDGINFGGCIMDFNLSQKYNNGDTYERIYEKDNNQNVIKVAISFYEKDNDITFSCEKEINSEIVYKKKDSTSNEIITREEYEEFAIKFIRKNVKLFI